MRNEKCPVGGDPMSRNVTCSVAMATYKGTRYVLEQLRSIEEQTVLPDEVVICDDVSADDTVAVIQEYSKTSKLNIRLYQNEENLGFRKNFEKAISLCACDVVFLCDQDDVWVNTKVERVLQEFSTDPQLVYAFTDAYVTDADLKVTNDSIWSIYGIDWMELNRQTFFDYVQTRMFPLGFQVAAKREFLLAIMPFLSDHDGWIAVCAPAFGTVKAIPEKLVYYRRHENTTSGGAKNIKSSKLAMLKKIFCMKYNVYFIYPDYAVRNFACVMKYIEENNAPLNLDKLSEHLHFLDVINGAKDRNFLFRMASLRKLKKDGSYRTYRGSNKSYILDCLFMFVNSLKRNR